eukprot:TRINITY_DN6313_c0_g1_i1.p1 TRINITY_DN6313_c0_g1~~TRINITY_DN6313_c0_g1_i1.p1  ORF type:complete len:581 (-),score=37.24 TRINITY_DN6313_c0_g1_i1:19-1761(-)
MKYIITVLFVVFCLSSADEHSHKYKVNDPVLIWVNKIGPYFNPQETYLYHTLPFCKSGNEHKQESKMEGLGEALQGYELRGSGMNIKFAKETPKTDICGMKLTSEETKAFQSAIKMQYWYELFCDDMPIWGMVGDIDDRGDIKIYTHKKFTFSYNGDRIVDIKLNPEEPVEVKVGAVLNFTYSAVWLADNEKEYEHRFDKYLDDTFFEHQIHWFSIFNSFMMVVFLVGLVSMILMRTLKKDFARITQDDDDETGLEVGDESGWKQVKGDVFRAPARLMLFSALYGAGIQIAVLLFLVIVLSISFYHSHFIYKRGSLVTSFIGCYAITSFIAGYMSGSFYLRYGGKQWIQTMILTCCVFPGSCFVLGLLLDFIATAYGSLASIPLGTMAILLILWLFFSVPLTVVGTIIGRNWSSVGKFPCRVNPVPRIIPEKKWYQEPVVHIILGGILPFGSIFIEMYFVFTAFWQYKYYYVFGFLLLVFLILIIVSICDTIVSTYFLLNSEDYRWHWVSFLSSASAAVYVYIYAIYYFVMKTKMYGFLQTCFYFGYTLMFCVGLGIMTGAVGFYGTSVFVNRIFSNKLE